MENNNKPLINSRFAQEVEKLEHETTALAAALFAQGKKPQVYRSFFRSVRIFLSEYFGKAKRKDGMTGLFLSVNEAMKLFITHAKLWELVRNQKA